MPRLCNEDIFESGLSELNRMHLVRVFLHHLSNTDRPIGAGKANHVIDNRNFKAELLVDLRG